MPTYVPKIENGPFGADLYFTYKFLKISTSKSALHIHSFQEHNILDHS
jgi:hypothetical protein